MSSQWEVAAPDLYGCRLWQGKLDKDGYGVVWQGKGRPSRAHRIAWEEARGPIPKDRELEHRCRRRNCVAIAHLMLVTRQQNEWRKKWSTRVKAPLCDAGHGAINAVITPEDGRVCRLCSRGEGEGPDKSARVRQA